MTQTPDPTSLDDVLAAVHTLTTRFDRLDTAVTKLDLKVDGLTADMRALNADLREVNVDMKERFAALTGAISEVAA